MATWTTAFSAKNQYTLTLTLTEKSYNIATNKSTVEYTLTMACSGYVGFSDYRVQASLTVGGVQKLNYNAVRAFNVPVKASYSEVLSTGTIDITHALDGTGSCVGAAYVLVADGGDGISPGRAPSSGNLGGTLTLTTIPRASTATVPSAYTIGATGSAISIATASSAFTHRLKFSTGSQSQTVNLAAGTTSYTWTPAAATWGPQFPTQTSRSVTVLLETLSGGTVIGSNTYTTTLSIPASWKPTVSASLSQYSTNSFMSGKAFYVAGYSAIRAAITGALGDSYTTIKSYTISGAWSKTVTTTASSTTQTSGVIASSGTKTTTITITDARGRTGTWSGNVSFLSYAVPAITTLTYARGTYSGGVWTSSASGTDLRIQFKATCSLSGNGNDMDWTIGAPVSASGTSLASGTQVEKFKTGIGTTTLYTVAVTVKDDIGNTVTRSITVPTIAIPFVIDHAKPAIGVGAIPQTARTLDLASEWGLRTGRILGYPNNYAYTPGPVGYHIVPTATFTDTGLGTSGVENTLKEMLKKLCEVYPNRYRCIFVGGLITGTAGYYTVLIYDTNAVDANGYPQYSVGEYCRYAGYTGQGNRRYAFGTMAYTPYMHDDTIFMKQVTAEISVAAGTIGTRGGQKVWTTSDIGGIPRYVFVADFTSSNNCHRELCISGTSVYLNIYRAASSAFTEKVWVNIYYTPT